MDELEEWWVSSRGSNTGDYSVSYIGVGLHGLCNLAGMSPFNHGKEFDSSDDVFGHAASLWNKRVRRRMGYPCMEFITVGQKVYLAAPRTVTGTELRS